jgi:hypothetical protein
MNWTTEPNEDDRRIPNQVLVLDPDEPILPALVNFWRTLLSDACATGPSSPARCLCIEICEEQSEGDEQGCLHARFTDDRHQTCKGMAHYLLRGDAFTRVELPSDDGRPRRKKRRRSSLQQYSLLNEAARHPDLKPLFETLKQRRALSIKTATGYGWFDLQIDPDSFERRPSEDQAVPAEEKQVRSKPLDTLLGGIVDVGRERLIRELNAALIAYAPRTSETIVCEVTEGMEQGRPALFYDLQFPPDPDDTPVVDIRVQRAATKLIHYLKREQPGFAGMVVTLEHQKDGSWLCGLKLMSGARS